MRQMYIFLVNETASTCTQLPHWTQKFKSIYSNFMIMIKYIDGEVALHDDVRNSIDDKTKVDRHV